MKLSPLLPALLAASTSLASASQQQPLLTEPPTDETPLLALHRQLMEIESTSGHEAAVGSWLSTYLRSLGLSVRHLPVPVSPAAAVAAPSRFNVLAYPPSTSVPRILLTSHLDTVPPFIPYRRTANESGSYIWGRGANDAKGSVAAQVTAWQELKEEGRLEDGDVGLLFVVGEETGGVGMKAASKQLEGGWEAVVFGEPTEGRLVSGHKGMLGFVVEVRGRAAHSGYPWLGASANEVLVYVLNEILGVDWPESEKYGRTTLNIGKIEGGVAGNVVPENATATCAVRIAKGTPEDIKKLIADAKYAAWKKYAKDIPGADVQVNFWSESYPPVDIDSDIEGLGKPITVNYGTDVPHLEGDHKRYLYGPGSILVAHSDNEYVTVKDLEQAVVDYKKIVLQLLERKKQ